MSKAQKSNKENKKPKADKNRVKDVSAYKSRRKARGSRPAAGSEKDLTQRWLGSETEATSRNTANGRPLEGSFLFQNP